MRKAQFKRMKHKEHDVQWRYGERQWLCTSRKWIRWAKSYMNRAARRKAKQEPDHDTL